MLFTILIPPLLPVSTSVVGTFTIIGCHYYGHHIFPDYDVLENDGSIHHIVPYNTEYTRPCAAHIPHTHIVVGISSYRVLSRSGAPLEGTRTRAALHVLCTSSQVLEAAAGSERQNRWSRRCHTSAGSMQFYVQLPIPHDSCNYTRSIHLTVLPPNAQSSQIYHHAVHDRGVLRRPRLRSRVCLEAIRQAANPRRHLQAFPRTLLSRAL